MLNQDFNEFLQLLNDNEVEYLLVGGYAVAIHGYPRYTKDIDLWINAKPTNAQRLIATLEQFGFGSLDLRPEDFLVPDQIIQLGYPPARIDILTTLPGVDFDTCFQARLELSLDEVTVNVIDLDNLKRSKQASGRTQDLADLENLS